jgi:C4-dicarboxylate transporter, DctM subunit
VIRSVAPDISLRDIVVGVLPFVGLMTLVVVVLCMAPAIAMWLPNLIVSNRAG